MDGKGINADVGLPIVHGQGTPNDQWQTRRTRRNKRWSLLLAVCLSAVIGIATLNVSTSILQSLGVGSGSGESVQVPINAADILDTCRSLDVKPGPPSDFHERKVSDRFVKGTKSVLIKVCVGVTRSASGKAQFSSA